jgi:hypothetical protein
MLLAAQSTPRAFATEPMPFGPVEAAQLAARIATRLSGERLADFHSRRDAVARSLLNAAHTPGSPMHRHLHGAQVRATAEEHATLLRRVGCLSLMERY